MLTDKQRKDIRDVLDDYEEALLDGDTEAVETLGKALDIEATNCRVEAQEDEDNVALFLVIERALDERSPIEAVDWVRAAKLIVGTL